MIEKKIVTCTGYGSTGSSVITDLLKEFDNVNSLGDFEFTFLSTVNGVRDLEYGLFELNNRSNVDIYIKRFMKEMNHLSHYGINHYEKWFNGNFEKLSLEFIHSIIDVEWNGYNMMDIRDESIFVKIMYYSERIYQKKILRLRDTSANFYTKVMKKKRYYACPTSREAFYDKVKIYTEKLANEIKCSNNEEYIVFDQLVPATDIENYLKYVQDLKVIVIDRDPRDLYLLEKHQYKEMFIPYQDVKTFVTWYRMVRECKANEEHSHILRLQFEDFIYNYDKAIEDVMQFLDLKEENWKSKKEYFNPKVSIKNTAKMQDYTSKEDRDEVAYIEKELKQYCYDFKDN